MIIGIDASASGFKSTGTGRYINCLLEQLTISGNEITTFPASHSGKEFHLERKMSNFVSQKLKRNYYRISSLTNEMMKRKVDCGIFPNYFISRNFARPSAIVIHDLSFITHPQFYSKKFVLYYKYLIKQTLKQNPLILTVSEHTKKNIHKHLNINEEDIFLLQAYSNIKKMQNKVVKQLQTESPYLLYVGHIEPRKNLLFMVENFLKWKNENKVNLKLKLIGETWIRSKEINYLLRKYSNSHDVEFGGYVSDDELDSLYKNAFGFIHTSFEEGFGFPVLEAMNYGVPVLCSNNHAAKEISSTFSITINPYNNESFKKGLSELYERKINNEVPQYAIKYSPELMQKQLNVVLDILQSRISTRIYFSSGKSETHEEAIEKTLLYSHLFNGGLHKNDLYKFLFDVRIDKEQFENALRNLLYFNKVNLKNDNVSLNYHNINIYKKEIKKLDKKRICRSLKIIKRIPFISCVCFSGGTANYGIENHDDIDLFIITKPNSVYFVYLMIHVLSKVFNLRKQLCANFLIDETNLEIKEQHDYYTAHQIVSLIPFKNGRVLELFRQSNSWTVELFPNYISHFPFENSKVKKRSNIYLLLKPMNIIIKHFYRFLYRNHLKEDNSDAIKLDDSCIKLYTNDHRKKILEAFNREWQKYLNIKELNVAVTPKVTGTYD